MERERLNVTISHAAYKPLTSAILPICYNTGAASPANVGHSHIRAEAHARSLRHGVYAVRATWPDRRAHKILSTSQYHIRQLNVLRF